MEGMAIGLRREVPPKHLPPSMEAARTTASEFVAVVISMTRHQPNEANFYEYSSARRRENRV